MRHTQGVDSEVGRLRTVLVHRPGTELKRITPRSKDCLLFDALPWVGRAQQEHDIFTQALRDHGAEVLYVTELLQDALEYQPARQDAIASVLAGPAALGDELRALLQAHLVDLAPEPLARVLIDGLTPEELPGGRGVVFQLLDRHDFVIPPLPNLVFSRDSSSWIGDRVAVSSPAVASRRREAELMQVIYAHHPRFWGTKSLYSPDLEPLDGGDVLLLAPSVLAVGVGDRTSPAGLERLARRVFDAGLAHTVLAVPAAGRGAGCLDTICTVIDADAVIMHPAAAFTLTAHTITPRPDGMRVSRPQPFLEAAAQAMGIDRLKVIDTGTDPLSRPGQQWEDGGNALVIGPRAVVCHERNAETNSRLEAAGVEVIRVPGSELGSRRGGPRGMACPVCRDPAAEPEAGQGADGADERGLGRPVPAAAI